MANMPKAVGTSRRPTVDDADTEEALRILVDRITALESVTTDDDASEDYDDSAILRELTKLWREIDKVRKSVPAPTEAGDTYDGPFKVYQTDGEDLQVTIDAGRFIYGSGTSVIAQTTEDITASDDTYYVYFEASYSAGLVTNITFSTSKPTQSATVERVLLAEVDVVSSVIDAVRQVRFGEIHSNRIWN